MKRSSFIPEALKHAHHAESLRSWQIICFVLVVIIGLQGAALATLYPLKEIKPVFIQFAADDHFEFRSIPYSQMNREQEAFLVRNFLRRYVRLRETRGDIAVEAKNFDIVHLMTTADQMALLKKDYMRQKPQLENASREIKIISDSEIEKGYSEKDKTKYGIHQIEFQTTDTKDGFSVKNLWFATIRYVYALEEVTESQALKNPMNIRVHSYKISKRDIQPKSTPRQLELTPFSKSEDSENSTN